MLEVQNLNAYYGTAQALFDVSITLEKNEILALIGANGAGKTTLMRTISGITLKKTGEILFEGNSILHVDAAKIVSSGIAHVPEGRKLFPGMTVADNLKMGAYLRRDRAAVQEDLEQVFQLFPRLKERRTQLAGKMSGGEQQMCAIGRGLMSAPKVLLIDELSLGLAPVIVDELIETVASLRRGGMSIILVEQDVQTGLELADRAYVIEHGRVTLSGPAQELIQNEQIRQSYLGI